jgi:hypothetical protein
LNNAEQHNKELQKLLNKLYLQITNNTPDCRLYTMTVKFNYARDFRSGGAGEAAIEARLSLLLYSMIKRLFYKPLLDNTAGLAFMDYSSDQGGSHVHVVLSVNESRFNKKYAGKSFKEFAKETQSKWILATDSRGNKDLLKGYWVGEWDGNSKLIEYSSKKYKSESLFSGSSPVYFNGLLQPPSRAEVA